MNLLLLVLLGGIWGTSFLFIKIIVAEIPPLTLVMGRLGMAAAVMWLLLLLRRAPRPAGKLWRAFAVVGLLNGALPFALISWGEQYIPSGWAALLQSTTPIFAVIFSHFLTTDDRLNRRKVAGVLIGFVGVGLLMGPEVREGLSASVLGLLAIVGSSMCYALATIYARHRLRDQPPMLSATGQFTMGLAYIAPMALLLERPFAVMPSPRALASWVTLAVGGTALAYVLYFALVRRASATFVTMVTYIVPINGLILGALVLGEPLSPMLFVSLGLILGGVLLVRSGGTS